MAQRAMSRAAQTARTTYSRGQGYGGAVVPVYFQPSQVGQNGGFAGPFGCGCGEAQENPAVFNPANSNSMSKEEADALKKVAQVSGITQSVLGLSEMISGITESAIGAKAAKQQLELQQAHELEMAPFSERALYAQSQLKQAEANLEAAKSRIASAQNTPLLFGIAGLFGIGITALLLRKKSEK
jgi:hypothetical protein